MNIVFLVNAFPVLSEKFLVNQFGALIDAGARLRIVSAGTRPKFASDTGAAASKRSGTTTVRGARVHRQVVEYDMLSKTVWMGLPASALPRALKGLGLAFLLLFSHPLLLLRALNIRRYRTATTSGKTIYVLWTVLRMGVRRRTPIELLHAHFGPNGILGAFLKDAGLVQALVVTFHGSDANTYPRRHGAGVYNRLWQTADLVTANTSFTAGKLRELGCPGDKIRILPVGLRISEYPYVPAASRSANTILTVARLSEKKGHRYALEALALLAPRYPDLEWIFAGGGELKASLEAQARELGVGGQVHMLGALSDVDLEPLWARAGIFVLPSVTAAGGDMEGQGLVLQEAQACGIPVVSTLHNGIPDGVLDGRSRLLVPEKDARALADAIASLLDDFTRRGRMGLEGQTFAANYDAGLLAAKLLEFYAELEAGRGSV